MSMLFEKPVTGSELHIKVAMLAGWTFTPKNYKASKVWKSPEGKWSKRLPELTLDWMHELWCKLTITQHQIFRIELQKIVAWEGRVEGPCRSVCNATKEQRARAYVATMERMNSECGCEQEIR